MQESRLQQLSADLKSELSAGSLTQLKAMVADFMQQLRDSMLRQSQSHPNAALPLEFATESLPQVGHLGYHQSSIQAAPQEQLQADAKETHEHLSRSRALSDQIEACLSVDMAQSQQQSVAQSVLTEDEIELALPESRASSGIEEEEGLAASRAAESVAESVSDFQYSVDFEGSIHRSPVSGFRSPAPGE